MTRRRNRGYVGWRIEVRCGGLRRKNREAMWMIAIHGDGLMDFVFLTKSLSPRLDWVGAGAIHGVGNHLRVCLAIF